MGFSNQFEQHLRDKARKERRAITVNLELLPVCNLQCRMCYIRTDMEAVKAEGGLISAGKWLKLAEELRDAGVLFILLTGGEVFLYPEFRELYIELYKMGFVITINTNAVLITENTVRWLEQYPPKCVSISLYGASDDDYYRLCGQKGVFTKVDHAIDLLMKHHITIECKTLLTPLNRESLKACSEYTKSRGIDYETAVYAYPPVRRKDKEGYVRFSPEEAVECLFECNRLMSSEEEYRAEIERQIELYEASGTLPEGVPAGLSCAASNTSCWITWKGDMVPCVMLDNIKSSPFENGFLQSWEQLKEMTDRMAVSSKCVVCDKRQVCTACPAASYAENGRADEASEYHCRMTEKMLEEMYGFLGRTRK